MGKIKDAPGPAPDIVPPCPLLPAHDIRQFACGNAILDEWLRRWAVPSEGRSSRTYVVCTGATVVGYYSLATGAVSRSALPRKIRHGVPDPVPLVLLGRLAVDSKFQGARIGQGLLKDALSRAVAVSETVGTRAVIVHAIDDQAVAFYAKAGFVEFPSGTRTMFLPIETIQAAMR